MAMLFQTKINKIGAFASAFTEEKMLILFGDGAPEELKDYCLSIDVQPVEDSFKEGDELLVDGKSYKVTAVGDAVTNNLERLGHITLKFDGSQFAELPGTLYLEEKELPEVFVGDRIQIKR
ncbi:PTS glucitol/sorbitol transporter subunit IIA [Bacillus sp. CLL-7-23]|uniref:PTS glucitol/sorbitol transporter subunit IIA n=1 Tax=Bacillus changyiensis TaxID=3004103 RepID=A0ABT4X168_9BACI|nr:MULTISPECIES: PTS glucitol/sorbitol transporter subunit IIA [Bacillus]MDA7025439.1 PTS glucitol/sorbitol transporter subunit IIA [Bacillus changyiensis]NPC94401.1 PTS glucitol/sorbitol transporter subunit IIA [Bacillus sp. WMMC1349]